MQLLQLCEEQVRLSLGAVHMVRFAAGGRHMPPRRTATIIQQRGADFSVGGGTVVSAAPGVTIVRDGVEIFAGTAYIADEVEMHEQGRQLRCAVT
jgi:hypothetical protein